MWLRRIFFCLGDKLLDLFNKYFPLSETHEVFEVTGSDRERFLQGQLSNDLEALKEGHFQLQARLDRGGRLKSFFYLMKAQEAIYGVIPKQLSDAFLEDINRFIIMDEVEINASSKKAVVMWPQSEAKMSFKGLMANYPAVICLGEFQKKEGLEKLSDEKREKAFLIGAEPVLGKTAKVDSLVTNTILNLNAVSLKKGCYLGQETVSKIETRRGGAHFPVVLKLKSQINEIQENETLKLDGSNVGEVLASFSEDHLLIISLIRNHRVIGKELSLEVNNQTITGVVDYLPLGGEFKTEKIVENYYEKAVSLFQSDHDEEAIEYFKRVLILDPGHEDSYEAIGVILGRQEKFEEGLAFMDKVLEANPNSVMAHTNKSLFYMRLGKIEEAEEEKAQATVKSFSSFGKEAEKKKALEEKKKQEEAEIQRRMEMFQQVLEIDPDDNLANYGMADIFYHQKKFKESVPLLEKVINVNQKYSVAYLLLGKVYLALDEKTKAKEVLSKGVDIASSQGDLMPANEMQSKLNELS